MRRDLHTPGRARDAGSTRSRGQTAQDFAVGIGLFLLAVAFVFAFVPQIISPYETGVGASEAAQADRTATLLVGNLSVDGQPNELNATATSEYFDGLGTDAIRDRAGLPFTARINVTVATLSGGGLASDGGTTWAAGATYREGRETATATRIVRTTGPGCEPGCELLVRVW